MPDLTESIGDLIKADDDMDGEFEGMLLPVVIKVEHGVVIDARPDYLSLKKFPRKLSQDSEGGILDLLDPRQRVLRDKGLPVPSIEELNRRV